MTFKQLAQLEWLAFKRRGNVLQTVLMGLGKGYFALCYLILAVASSAIFFKMADEAGMEPKEGFFKYAVYLWVGTLMMRYFFQKMPTTHIKPLLIQNVRKKKIVSYGLLKSVLSFFNLVDLLVGIVLLIQLFKFKYDATQNVVFALSFTFLLLSNCFLVQLLNNVTKFAVPFLVVSVLLLGADYMGYLEISTYTAQFFSFFYENMYTVLLTALLLAGLLFSCYNYYIKNLSLESDVVNKKEVYKYYDLNFLNRFGVLAPFLKLDLKLLTRNKRTKTVLYMSTLFLLYGLIFFNNETFEGSSMAVLAGIMITGGFMLMFGQYVPSWDSSYYPLMMTQNIPYRTYLESKWLIMVLGTLVSMVLASFYIYFGWKVYLTIVAVGFYNIGWNCYMSLFTGAYVRSKIELTSNKNAFGDSKAFNVQTLLLSMPTVLVPIILYVVLNLFLPFHITIIVFIAIGLLGILLKKPMFNLIEKLYKTQKYTTIKAYK